MIKARPILFSGPMVRALLAGTKTQTRRVVKPQPYGNGFIGSDGEVLTDNDYLPPEAMLLRVGKGRNSYVTSNYEGWESACPYGVLGDLLWVRETLRPHSSEVEVFAYAADDAAVNCGDMSWPVSIEKRPVIAAIHMPRWASRLTLRITDVRVQRLQDISNENARDEGVDRKSRAVREMWKFGQSKEEIDAMYLRACRWEFEALWESINGPGTWDANPWVWAISFEVIKANVDEVLAKP